MPREKNVSRTAKPGPATPKESGVLRTGRLRRVLRTAGTPAQPQAAVDPKHRIELSDTAMDAQNWRIIKPLLSDRIRRRREALRRLAGDEDPARTIESHLVAEGNDAAALWRLAEQIDSRLDRAFAPRARRAPLQDKPNRSGRSSGHDEYKAY